jgi:hypothetical protein
VPRVAVIALRPNTRTAPHHSELVESRAIQAPLDVAAASVSTWAYYNLGAMLEARAKTSSPFLHQDWALKLSPEYQIVLQDEHIEAVKVYEQLAAAFDALVGSLAPIVGDAQVGGRPCGGRESLTRGRGSSHSQWKGQAVGPSQCSAPAPPTIPSPSPPPPTLCDLARLHCVRAAARTH